MNSRFDFVPPSRTVFGNESLKDLPAILVERGVTSVFLLSDTGILEAGIIDNVAGLLRQAGMDIHISTDAPREPGDEDVDRIVLEVKRTGPDAIIGIGGGSVLDIAKLCSVLVKADCRTVELIDGTPVPEHSLYTVLVPTTSGTGSEATKNAIIAVPFRGTKGAVVHDRLLPDLVILDPLLTLSLPPGMTATTGIDALCHAMECFLSVKANCLSDILAEDAMKRIGRSIRSAVLNGSEIEARSDMILASYYAGMCISLSGTNAIHAMSYPLGVDYHIPHGQANAMLMPFVMERNLKALPEKTEVVAACFGYKRNLDRDPYSYLVEKLHTLVKDLGVDTNLENFGVEPPHLSNLADRAFGNRRLMDNNPLPLNADEIRGIYSELMGAG